MSNAVCPYPGLRPFTEEESIFFKGRDLHIRQIVKLLEQNKMAFITGASGDGKSSIVYAGVVPYIRAGFLKSEFNGWTVLDFKPERNPLASLAESVSAGLGVSYEDAYAKLKNGFSALVRLYTDSEFYKETKGKNLLIIADQFEEVFTMGENFQGGIPSIEAYICVNLLLETVRISMMENLPVYVIFTMRSDYISQCTVFRDLPEFAAYSQFFVPQLKRTEIREVIEQPAVLAGGKVSSRLAEVLVNNLNSGFDCLPVLQHALNLLWKTADNGKETLDLIHLAKIAGIDRDMLDDDGRREFDRWYSRLPDCQKKYYENPGLDNVLNAHAGLLYESAYDSFMKNPLWTEKNITPEDSKLIIETAFKCLTKTDNNRLVRNRCTLYEIKGVINRPDITEAAVCGVLNIFRTGENTLLCPFAEEGRLETLYLSGDTVLDVTHEALIRNWKLLSEWAAEEYANQKEYADFNSMVQRWADNSRNPEFLLSAGNYAMFSRWYERCRPNKYWILKNDSSLRSDSEKLRAAAGRMELCDKFMESSREAIAAQEKSHRTKVAAVIIGLLVFIAGLSLFSWWAVREKENADRQAQIARQEQNNAEQLRVLAEIQQRKAEDAQHRAEAANQTAEQQRDSARMMYRRAIAAKIESDRARRQAEDAQLRAEYERKNADKNYNLAEKERQNAIRQAELTDKANDKAEQLYYLALCNTLAMKAKNKYEDKTLNLRLAKTACEMGRNSGAGSGKNADLYDAMLYALEQNSIVKPLDIPSETAVKSFAVTPSGEIVTVDASGTVCRHHILSDGSLVTVETIGVFADRTPVETAVFITPNVMAYSLKDRRSYLVEVAAGHQTEISGTDGYIQAASPSPDGKTFALACFYGKVAVMTMDSGSPVVEHDFKKAITDVYYHSDGEVYVLCHDGTLLKWDYKEHSVKNILKPTGRKIAFKTAAVSEKNLLAVCYSDGGMQFLSLNDDTPSVSMTGGHTKIEDMVYDPVRGILALSSADNRITLINTNDFDENPLVIEEHSLDNRDVLCMGFNKSGILFAITDDNKLRFWDTDPSAYEDAVMSMRLAPLSDAEWKLILGKEFSTKN